METETDLSKADVARALALAHSRLEPSVVKVARLVSDREDEPDEPVKLLELNTDTLPTGIVPVYFGPSGEIPFPSLVIEVTESEYRQIETRELSLPGGWRPAETLFERNWER